MMALLGLFLKDNWKPITAIAGAAAIVGGIYIKGHSDGSAAAEQAAKTAVTNQIKQRNATDEKVEGMSPTELCGAIGGVWSNDGCQ